MKEIVQRDETMAGAYAKLREQFEAVHGEMTAAAEGLLQKAAYLEGLHQLAVQELTGKGLREKYMVSSFTAGTRENKALGQLIKIQTQQARLLKELKLLPDTPRNAKAKEDEPEDINDY
jgi:hypothetical protein